MPRQPRKTPLKRAGKPARPRAVGRVGDRTPLWRTVARSLEKDIVSGRLVEGSRLPTETMLSRQFGVNRHTLRRAVAELVRKGLLRSTPQSGHVVAPLRIAFPLSAVSRISDAIELAGLRASFKLLSERIGTAPPDVARQLKVAHRTPVIEINLLRLSNDIPITYTTAWLPADRFAGIGKLFELTGSLRRAIIKAGVPSIHRKSTRIISRRGEASECDVLGLDHGSTLLTLTVLDVDPQGEPVTVFHYRFSALRTEFVIET